MKYLYLGASMAFPAWVLAQGTDTNIPRGCQFVCESVTAAADTCASAGSDTSSCVCGASSMDTVLPVCQACITANSREGPDPVIEELMGLCGFASVGYDEAAASAIIATAVVVPATSTAPVSTLTSATVTTDSPTTSSATVTTDAPTTSSAPVTTDSPTTASSGTLDSVTSGFTTTVSSTTLGTSESQSWASSTAGGGSPATITEASGSGVATSSANLGSSTSVAPAVYTGGANSKGVENVFLLSVGAALAAFY